jgi:hypothetical protein
MGGRRIRYAKEKISGLALSADPAGHLKRIKFLITTFARERAKARRHIKAGAPSPFI